VASLTNFNWKKKKKTNGGDYYFLHIFDEIGLKKKQIKLTGSVCDWCKFYKKINLIAKVKNWRELYFTMQINFRSQKSWFWKFFIAGTIFGI
jgi:hypothetical protein